MWGDDLKQWKLNNWGDYTEPYFDAGWIMNNSVLLKIHGGSPDKLNEILKSHTEVESFTLSYSGFEDEFSKPDFCGIWNYESSSEVTFPGCIIIDEKFPGLQIYIFPCKIRDF